MIIVFPVPAQTYDLIDFEDAEIPSYVSATRSSSLSTTTVRRKYGNQSLLWNWKNQEKLIFEDAPGMDDGAMVLV